MTVRIVHYPQAPVFKPPADESIYVPSATDRAMFEIAKRTMPDYTWRKSAWMNAACVCWIVGFIAFPATFLFPLQMHFLLLSAIGTISLALGRTLPDVAREVICYDDFETWQKLRQEALDPAVSLDFLVKKHGSLNVLRHHNLLTAQEGAQKYTERKQNPALRQGPLEASEMLLNGFMTVEEWNCRVQYQKRLDKLEVNPDFWGSKESANCPKLFEEFKRQIGWVDDPKPSQEFMERIALQNCDEIVSDPDFDLYKLACPGRLGIAPSITSEQYGMLLDYQEEIRKAQANNDVCTVQQINQHFNAHFKKPTERLLPSPAIVPEKVPAEPSSCSCQYV